MQTQSRLPLIALASSILLPYSVVISNTALFTTNQNWLFPLWIYLNDFGNWLGFGVIVPPLLPSIFFLPSVLGLFWLILGLYNSEALRQFFAGLRDAESVRLLTISFLIFQIIVTIVTGFIFWDGWLVLVVPLPLHFLIVLFLVRVQVQRVNHERSGEF